MQRWESDKLVRQPVSLVLLSCDVEGGWSTVSKPSAVGLVHIADVIGCR
jgi:hypothetical protein